MSSQGALGSWYRKILGEPLEDDHVYGYWTFLLGAVLGLAGLVVYLYSAMTIDPALEVGGGPSWTLRAIAAAATMLGGTLVFLSVVMLLPLQRRAMGIALIGALICVSAIGVFWWAYPNNWYWEGASPDYSPIVMAVYSLGILVMIATAFVFPLATDSEDPIDRITEPVKPRQPESDASFEVYEDQRGTWRWRLVHDDGTVLADGNETYSDKRAARRGLESVRKNAPEAGERTLDRTIRVDSTGDERGSDPGAETDRSDTEGQRRATADATDEESAPEVTVDPEGTEDFVAESDAQFETYQDRSGRHRWRVRHRNGNIIGDSGQGYSTARGRDGALERVKSVLPEADTLDYEPAAYELYPDEGGQWRWRLRHRNGQILAKSSEGYSSPSNARRAIDSVQENAASEEQFETFEDREGKYRWRLVAGNDDLVAESSRGYARTSSVRDAVDRVSEYAPEADTLDYEPAAFELYEDRGGKWRWRLRHRNGNVLADSGQGYTSKAKAKQGMQSVIRNGPAAEIVETE